MHRRQRLILQAGLALIAGLLAWRLGTEWTQANLRYRALSLTAGRSPGPVAATPLREPPPTDEIAAKNLFSPDRTNEVTEVAAVKIIPTEPPPAVPTVFGTMKLGENYEALIAEAGSSTGRAFRRVKQGEQIGSYTVVEILDEKVVIEYQGQRTTVDVYQSARSVARPATRTAKPAGPAAPVVVETAGGGSSAPARGATGSRPSATAESTAAAPPPTGTPPGVRVTIEGNRKRIERDTPFGVQTYYEPLEQGAGK